MEDEQGGVNGQGSRQSLENAHDYGGASCAAQRGQAELTADGKGDKAQGHITDGLKSVHQLKGFEADAGNPQPANEAGAQKHPGDEIGGDVGQMKTLEKTGHHKARYQRDGNT